MSNTSTSLWQTGDINESNHEQMLALFARCFGHEMSTTHWHWKYGQNRGQAIGVWQDQQLIGHYGGTTRDILFFGQKEHCLQPCDVMVDKAGRKTLSRTGPFFLVVTTFLERYLGYGKKHLLAIGFPNDRHLFLAQRLELYADEVVERMVEISWQPLNTKPRLWTEIRKITNDDRHEKTVNKLWQRMSQDFDKGIIGVRDWHYLKNRYFNHPDKHYQLFLIRNRIGKKVCGLCVCRQHEDDLELVDIITPLKNRLFIIEQARRLANSMGKKRLFGWTTEHYSKLMTAQGSVQPLDIFVPVSIWTEGPPLEQIQNRWWLTGGDTDFR